MCIRDRYEAVSAAGVHLRFFSVDTSNNLLSEEYQLAGSWSDGPNALTVSSVRDTPVSVRLQGTWTRTDAAGAALSNISVAWSTANGNYFFHNAITDNPSLTNAAGNWTDQTGATQAVTATADPFLFLSLIHI